MKETSKHQRRRCNQKRGRGNVYLDQVTAWAVARADSRRSKLRIVAYVCPVCGLYHVGRGYRGASRPRSLDLDRPVD